MNDGPKIDENDATFTEWCELMEFAESRHGLDQAGFNSLCDRIGELEGQILASPANSTRDVWRKVVVAVDLPSEEEIHQEAILARLARSALGLQVNRVAP